MPIARREHREFERLRIGLASPERILSWSHGEVEKPETINYRTFKPERKGLFDEKIFGPVKDWECHCGKYRRVRYRGITCERCGVEVTTSRVRRERMAHIKLAVPVSHVWFLRGVPSYMGVLLDLSTRFLEEVIYYDAYIVTSVEDDLKGKVKLGQVLREPDYQEAREKHGNKFKVEMGAKGIRDLLEKLDLSAMATKLRRELKGSAGQRRIKVVKQLRVVEAFLQSGNRPEWMIMDVYPVMPPDLRPMVQLEGGRFATSDLNDLYRRVLNRNNRLKKMIAMGAPEMIVRNEKRMLQEAVDVLIDNGRRKRAVLGSTGRPLKSLSDIIEGKQGRFRQNLLGKRADYSGRSVIVVGPSLKMHQCGLPKEMALELFKPFVIRRLVSKGLAQNVKNGKRMIERRELAVWDNLEEAIQGHPVFLNRAPTLHRLGIQAFEPILVEGKAIQIHPLVCPAFNADFDGDQMAVHVPLMTEAQVEARVLMLSTNNILSPGSGRPIITPTQDMVLGCYYLTVMDEREKKGVGQVFANASEAILAYSLQQLDLHVPVRVRTEGQLLETTVGRVIFNDTVSEVFRRKIPDVHFEFINEVVNKKRLEKIIKDCYDRFGAAITAEVADEIKRIGFKYATVGGVSIGLDDLIVPSIKKGVVARAEQEVAEMERHVKSGVLSTKEQFIRSLDIWSNVTETITEALVKEFDRLNPVYMMAFSGARGNIQQVRQLSGIRGLMADPSGNIISIPIKTNFKEGLNVTEYFISCYGARKGLVDTALRTADSGYLTRRLVDVAQDVVVNTEDCGTTEGIELASVREGFEEIIPLSQRVLGRTALKAVHDPITNKVIVKAGEEMMEEYARKIAEAGIEKIWVRSVLTCKVLRGLCLACYGRDLSSGGSVNVGEAVGIIAAQSIGEPGTQLTMRTFHIGGVAVHKGAKVQIRTKHGGKVQFGAGVELKDIPDEQGRKQKMVARESTIYVKVKDKKEEYVLPVGAVLWAKDGESVAAGAPLAEFDPTYEYVIASTAGKAYFVNIEILERKRRTDTGHHIEFLTKGDGEVFVYNPKVTKEYDIGKDGRIFVKEGEKVKAGTELAAGVVSKISGIVLEVREKGKGAVTIAPGETYSVLAGSRLFVENNSNVENYDVLAKVESVRRDPSKTRDIIQGLPKVEELFEGRRPKDPSTLSDIPGTVTVSEREGARVVSVKNEKESREYLVPYELRLKVSTGDHIDQGTPLTYGTINPHDVLRIQGVQAAQTFLVDEIQKIYRGQGVTIHDKHIEVIVRQMTRRVRVLRPGDTTLLPGELIEKGAFERLNVSVKGETSQAIEVLLGITKASLSTDSLISAASFQETARVLTDAAVRGREDEMYGLKENVIIGKLIPAGTGFSKYRHVEVIPALKMMEEAGSGE